MGAVSRKPQIRRRRKRQATQRKLKARLAKASPSQSANIMKRLQRVMLAAPLRQFMQAANAGPAKKAA